MNSRSRRRQGPERRVWLWGLAGALALVLAAEVYLIAKIGEARGPAMKESKMPAADPVPAVPPKKKEFILVVDPGHTPEEFGALSARGTPERDFNQAMAALLIEELAKRGVSTMLTNGPGQSADLQSRADMANRAGASLFLSIHHDSSEESAKLKWKHKGKVFLYCDRYRGFSLFVSDKAGTYEASLRFARALGRELRTKGFSPCLHHSDPIKGEGRELIDPELGIYGFPELAVLRETRMPAVLVEYGFIINRQEEKALLDPRTRTALAEATALAVIEFKKEIESKGR